MKAIDTKYKNHLFRSRLEARWAVFFDTLSVEWLYEPEGFQLPNGSKYLPDFFLPDHNLWVEIKPAITWDDRWPLFASTLDFSDFKLPFVVLIGDPGNQRGYFVQRKDTLLDNGYGDECIRGQIVPIGYKQFPVNHNCVIEDSNIKYAIQKACSARFDN